MTWIDIRTRKPTREDADDDGNVLQNMDDGSVIAWTWDDLSNCIAWLPLTTFKPVKPPPGYRIVDTTTEPFCKDALVTSNGENWSPTVQISSYCDGMWYAVPAEPEKSPTPDETVGLNAYAADVHAANSKWWHDLETGDRLERNKGEMQMLIVSEIAEAMEGVRKGLMDDHLPHRTMEEVEMADALIRIFDYCGGHGLDIDGAYREKMAYNASRADHKVENRRGDGGKKF